MSQAPPLRIAMLVPPWYELPPRGYGGLELVVAQLIDALVARGHHVTLFGAGTRTGTGAEFVSTVPQPQHARLGMGMPELVHVARADTLIDAGAFDVVHDHTDAGLLTAPRRRAATIATVHGCPTGELANYLSCVDPGVALVAISHAQRRLGVGLPWTATVHNGLRVTGPVKSWPSSGPALWLARFNPDKGPDLAIRACRAAGVPLVLAGKATEPGEREYLDVVIKPMLHPDVRLLVNPGARECRRLLAGARCLILPVRWEEPFGMVMIEAMAAGTPVVALNRGAVPELVRHGETGIVCAGPEELPDAVHAAREVDPRACARHVRTSFSAELMAQRYEQVYRAWAGTRPARAA
ncbi:MAG TPA: glycosyltransferase family 4 protein [Rugosimonospora sp.]|nr:glycosyltransferase family 4 protein [Rugosimonospora sp.]